MISERIVARGFGSIWATLFPMLTPAFMNSFNKQFVKPVYPAGAQVTAAATPSTSDSPDLVAELGIQVARSAVDAGVSVEDVAADAAMLRRAWRQALELVGRYEGEMLNVDNVALLPSDRDDGLRLARTVSAFLDAMNDHVDFAPKIPGAGTLSSCEADLAVGETLVEVKTVSRNFRSSDLRQLLVYLALDWARVQPSWNKGCLFNPRRAVWADFPVDWLVRRLSGRTASETFSDLVDALAGDVELETGRF